MYRFLATVVCWMPLLAVQGQTLADPVYVQHSVLPASSFSNEAGRLAQQWLEASVTVPPIKLGKRVQLYNGLYYRFSALQYSEASSTPSSLPDQLHDFRYTLIARAQLSARWELVAIPRVMLRSDLSQPLSTRDLFPQVVMLANYGIKGYPQFKVGLGLALNNDFERNAIIPIGALQFENRKLKIELVYPNANLMYKLSDKAELGLFASVDGAISRVSAFELAQQRADYLRTFQLLAAPAFSYRIRKQVFAHFKLGVSTLRTIEAMNSDFKPIAQQQFDLPTALFVRTGISVRIQSAK